MTMGPVEIERKVRQLDNDVQSIYTMLSAIQGTQERHTNRLGELAVKVDSLDTKVDNLDTKVDNLEHKVDSLSVHMDSLDTKVDSLEGKIDTALALLTGNPES
jgi:chaperonin cofactor prefoldin